MDDADENKNDMDSSLLLEDDWMPGYMTRAGKVVDDGIPDYLSRANLLLLQKRLRSLQKDCKLSYDTIHIVLPPIKIDNIVVEFGDVSSPLLTGRK